MKKYFLYFLGLNLIAFAVVLNVRFDLGVAAFSSVMYSISQIYNISLGTASIICYLIFVIIQCILSKKITVTFILEIPLSFAFGWLTDLYDFIIPTLSLSLYLRVICFIMTMFITAMGVFLRPTDGIVKTISEVFSFPFSIVKNTFDITLVFVTIILCLINHTPFYGLGIGTILTALFIGRIINIYEKKIQLSF